MCLHCSNLHLVFTNEKGELTILTTKHGLLARQHREFDFWRPIMATTNLLRYKSENLFSDPGGSRRVIMAILRSYAEDLFSYHSCYCKLYFLLWGSPMSISPIVSFWASLPLSFAFSVTQCLVLSLFVFCGHTICPHRATKHCFLVT